MKRQPHKTEGNMWGIPGGKVEKGETSHQAVMREIREETGLDLPVSIKYFGKVYIRYPEVDFIYHMYGHDLDDYPADVSIDPPRIVSRKSSPRSLSARHASVKNLVST